MADTQVRPYQKLLFNGTLYNLPNELFFKNSLQEWI